MNTIEVAIWVVVLVAFMWPATVAAAIWFAMARGFAFGIQRHERETAPLASSNGKPMDKKEKFQAIKA